MMIENLPLEEIAGEFQSFCQILRAGWRRLSRATQEKRWQGQQSLAIGRAGFRRNSLTGFRRDINEVVLASSRCARAKIESKTEIREHL